MMDKLALNRKEAAAAGGISLPTLDAYLKRVDNPIPHFRAGRKVLIPAEGLRRWIEEEAQRQGNA